MSSSVFPPAANAPRVLVVEDNPLTRKMLRLTLESEGYLVSEAADGRAALAAVEQEKPALVLQDLVLPDMNGFELLRRLRQLGGQATPIIALTGFLSRIEEARGAEVGFTALLLKPVEPSHLLEFIRPYLPSLPLATPPAQGCRVLVVDDDQVQLKLTRLHLTQLGFEVMLASSSSEALRNARAQLPDVVLADVLMPDLDGFQLCFQIRKDPALCRLPVILASAWYETAADRELAWRVGANALLRKTPDLQGMPEVIHAAVRQGAPHLTAELDAAVRLDHAQAVIRQLQRQVNLRSDLTRRCTLQAAQIALLSGVADALALNTDADAALRDVLAATLDAAGISKGALFLQAEEGNLALRHAIGFTPSEQDGLLSFFGHAGILQDAVQRQATLSIPSPPLPEALAREILDRVDAASAQIVPLTSDGRGVGAMVLCAKHTDVTNDDSIAFARAMGNQLAQSLDLAKSFARLTASERRYRAVTEAAHEAISILTPDGVIQEVNPSFEAALGLSREHLVGRRIEDFAPAGQQLDSGKSLDAAREAGAGPAPVALSRSDGSIVLMEFTSRSVDLGAEKFNVSIGRDVTERVKTQAQLMFSDRMASIGSLAAGVAHEINNPLTATLASLEFAREHVAALAKKHGTEQLADLDELLRDASAGAQCVRTIVRDLKIFSRAEEDNRGPVDVQRVLESSVRMAWNEIRHRAELVREYASVPAVEANESRLGQVFLNLIVNAVQALPDGYADQNRISIRTRLDASGRVVAEVEDTGPGIPPDVLQRLFTPFFTTKPRGVGTGLGLSICRRIVKSFGGEIQVDSVVGRGTRFSVSLLAAARRADTRSTAPPQVAKAARRGRVLVVDDDAMSATAVTRGLAAEHDVVVSDNADAALERLLQGERFDAIICDLMMPVKTGVEFFDDVASRAPELAERIIFLTGGAFTVKAREFLDRVTNPRLEKPFDLPALRAFVNAQVR
jgi:PAS domain S-box-containing protein